MGINYATELDEALHHLKLEVKNIALKLVGQIDYKIVIPDKLRDYAFSQPVCCQLLIAVEVF